MFRLLELGKQRLQVLINVGGSRGSFEGRRCGPASVEYNSVKVIFDIYKSFKAYSLK